MELVFHSKSEQVTFMCRPAVPNAATLNTPLLCAICARLPTVSIVHQRRKQNLVTLWPYAGCDLYTNLYMF